MINLRELAPKEKSAFLDRGLSMHTYRAGLFAQQKNGIKYNDDYSKVDFLPDTYIVNVGSFKTNFFYKDLQTPIETLVQGTKINAKAEMKRFIPFKKHDNITFYQYTSMDFFSIDLKRNNGIHYFFNDYDISTIYNAHPKANGDTGVPQVSAWHVSKIEDTNTGEEINFEYHKQEIDREMSPFSQELLESSNAIYNYTSVTSLPFLNTEKCKYHSKVEYSEDDRDDNIIKLAQLDVERKILKKISF
ncbi:hypothetical protein [Myroides odoratimimus]|uniref:hypothetical protein n=1 Tax=Myroides odoratimimus TaxID=76832 RepID=UPI00046AAD1E|nr:hypothetical protein [Myroides odoratimimus]